MQLSDFKNIVRWPAFCRTMAAGGLLVLLAGCDTDFLERKPLDKISEADVWQDPALVEAFVNTCYRIRHGFLVDYYMMPLSDEAYRRGRETYHLINRGELSPVNNTALDHWADLYTTITNCNIFFQKLEGSPVAADLKARFSGEVTFLRAWCYFRLMSFYGGVPLITHVFELDDDFNVKRNSYRECLEFVVGELDKAAELLPLTYTGGNRGRITRGAALALKSRVLLYAASPLNNPEGSKEAWQKAADAAKAVIDLGMYKLYPDYKKLFTTPFNEEVIWSRQFQNKNILETSIELHF